MWGVGVRRHHGLREGCKAEASPARAVAPPYRDCEGGRASPARPSWPRDRGRADRSAYANAPPVGSAGACLTPDGCRGSCSFGSGNPQKDVFGLERRQGSALRDRMRGMRPRQRHWTCLEEGLCVAVVVDPRQCGWNTLGTDTYTLFGRPQCTSSPSARHHGPLFGTRACLHPRCLGSGSTPRSLPRSRFGGVGARLTTFQGSGRWAVFVGMPLLKRRYGPYVGTRLSTPVAQGTHVLGVWQACWGSQQHWRWALLVAGPFLLAGEGGGVHLPMVL